MSKLSARAGFTLVEMIIVIVITGIIFGMVAIFIKTAVDSYFSSVRRAEMTDEADAALRFVGRDLQSALPNSVSCSANNLSILSVRSGGRYREYPRGDGTGTPLVFGSAVTTFETIGGNATSTSQDARGIAAVGSIVVGNLSAGASVCNAVAPGDNIAALIGSPGASVGIASTTFPVACDLEAATATNPNDREFGRFFVVDPGVVTYACDTGLTRNGIPMANRATGPNACLIHCDANNARVQTVSINLILTDPTSQERVNMLRQFHVMNLP